MGKSPVQSLDFDTGSLSPVKEDSSTTSSTASTNLQSAGTLSPVEMTTTSPGTKSAAATSAAGRPDRTTKHLGGTKPAKASKVLAEFDSWM